jgi:hypothetical protein
MAKQPIIFSDLYINMVRAGEQRARSLMCCGGYRITSIALRKCSRSSSRR